MSTSPDFDFDAAADEAVKRGTASLTEAVKAGARDGVLAAFKHLGLAALTKAADHEEPDGDEGAGGAGDGDGDEGAGQGDDGNGDAGAGVASDDGGAGESGGDGGAGDADPADDPANAAGADDMLYKGDLDVTKLITELSGLPAAVRAIGLRLDNLEKGLPTKGEIVALRTQVAELAKGTGALGQQLLVAVGDTATRLVDQPGRVHQPRINTNATTAAQRAGEAAGGEGGGKLTNIELAKGLAEGVITTQLKRTYDQHGKFCEDDAQNAEMEQKVRSAAAAYGKR